MIGHDDPTHAQAETAAHDVNPLQEPQDQHGQHDHGNVDAGAEAGSRPWAPLQARAMTRHTGKLASMLRTPPVTLPFRSELEGQFSQSLDGIEAHVGEVDAVRELGGGAAAEGDVVAFGDVAPSRGTVAHEVTHVLQARSGNTADHAGAEAEADQVKASVATGGRVGPIMQGARGVHLDASTVVDPKDITARELLVELHDIFTVVLGSLRMNKVAELHPFARYLKPPVQLPDAMFSHPAVHALIEPFHQRIDGLIAPEPVEAIVDKARAARTQFGAGLGPPHHVYMDSVGFALGNALTRKLQQSLHRMLPRYVLASKPRMVGKDIKARTGGSTTDRRSQPRSRCPIHSIASLRTACARRARCVSTSGCSQRSIPSSSRWQASRFARPATSR